MARMKSHCFSRAYEPIIIEADATLAAKASLAQGCPRGSPMTDLATNVLYFGDNLDILRRYLPDATADLVELDPPYATDAPLLAFEDT
jgi:hypothetical protein